jgi:hypothetical protein
LIEARILKMRFPCIARKIALTELDPMNVQKVLVPVVNFAEIEDSNYNKML